ncbi:MAG TPA: FHA domain-containing protein, partial [Longimicrobium sp.]|nr:FHA domain-containing protein [Longimicrobium sp.]
GAAPPPSAHPMSPLPPRVPPTPPAPAMRDMPTMPGMPELPGPLNADRIQLVGESGHVMTLGVRTPLGKHIVRQFGEDASFWDTEQCVVERQADGEWQVVPAPGTTNETLLNGARITTPQVLHAGDVIAVGREARGIAKLPLTARGV